MARKAVAPDALWAKLEFHVEGMPQTKGSWVPMMRRGKMGMRPDNEAEPGWAAQVAWTARAQLCGVIAPDRRRYAVVLRFNLPPVVRRGRANRRDLDKLMRSILDALQGIVWLDDEQIDYAILRKEQTGIGKPGVTVTISPTLPGD